MFHKQLLAVLVALTAGLSFTSSAVQAGFRFPVISVAGTPQTITAGQSVTFTVTYSCGNAWTSAKVQLFNGTLTNSNLIGAETSLTPPTQQGDEVTVSITATLTESTTYNIKVKITEVLVGSFSEPGCVAESAATPIVVTAPATTTTVAATTTIPATTTVATSLPKTGTDSNNALIALAVMTAGVAIIAGRRRLLTK